MEDIGFIANYSSFPFSSIKNYPVLPNCKRVKEDAKESQILLWLWNIFQERTSLNYETYLRDGIILCRLMNAVKPGSIDERQITSGRNLKEKRENIERFLLALKTYPGFPADHLFNLEDLLLLQNVPRVTNCLFHFGSLVAQDEYYDGPQLGEMPYEEVDPKTKRRAGMPFGEDLHVAHVSVSALKRMMCIDG